QLPEQLIDTISFMIDTDRKANSSVLHQVDLDPILRKEAENMAQVLFHDKRIIKGGNGDQHLFSTKDKRGNEGIPGNVIIHQRTGLIRMQKGFDIERYFFVLQGLDRFGMNNGSSVIGQLYRFM